MFIDGDFLLACTTVSFYDVRVSFPFTDQIILLETPVQVEDT